MWMNRYDVEDSAERWARMPHPVLTPASQTLLNLMQAVDSCSDGWPYWTKPSRAASKLQELVSQGNDWYRQQYQHPRAPEPTVAQYKKALTPIKSFLTRHPFVPTVELVPVRDA